MNAEKEQVAALQARNKELTEREAELARAELELDVSETNLTLEEIEFLEQETLAREFALVQRRRVLETRLDEFAKRKGAFEARVKSSGVDLKRVSGERLGEIRIVPGVEEVFEAESSKSPKSLVRPAESVFEGSGKEALKLENEGGGFSKKEFPSLATESSSPEAKKGKAKRKTGQKRFPAVAG